MLGIIDRFEQCLVVIELEDGSITNIKRKYIPEKAKEGDVLNLGSIISINYEETEKRRKRIEHITKDIWE